MSARGLTIWCSSCLPGRPCFVHESDGGYPPPAPVTPEDDLRSRIACILEASYWDRPYDDRIAAIRGMCDLTTNGLTASGDGERSIRDVLLELDNSEESHSPEYYVALADVANWLGIDLGRHQ